MSIDWWVSEDDLLSWRRELERLKRRARARLLRTLALAGLATLAVVWMTARRVPLAESRILIRVTEGTVLREDSPTSSRDLAQFLNDYAMSNHNLIELIKQRGLYPFERMRGDMFAVDELRGNLTLEVYRNQFIEARGFNADVRTARVSVRFRHEDPAVSYAVCNDLAQLIITSESRRREASSRDVADLSQVAVERVARRLEGTQRRLTAAQLGIQNAQRARRNDEIAPLQIEIMRLTEDIKAQVKLLGTMRANRARADLRHALDAGGMNMKYQIVDERPPPPPPEGKEIRLAMIGLAVFLIVLPLCAVGVGAFDSRIHDREDVQRLGLEVVGHVPRFAGFRVGSFRSRRHPDRRRS